MGTFKAFNKGKIFEFILFTLAVGILIMLGSYFSAFMPLFIFLSIIALSILGIRTHEKMIAISSLVASIIAFLLTWQMTFAITIFIFITIPAIAAGHAFKHKFGFRDILIFIASAYLFSILAILILSSYLQGINQIDKLIIEPSRVIFTEVYQDFKNKITVLENSGIDTGKLQLIKNYINISDIMYAFKLIIPALFIISSTLWAYITLMSINTLLKKIVKKEEDRVQLPSFYELSLSRGTVLVFVATFILILFVKQPKIYAAFVNINLILYCVFIFIGISVIDFYVRKLRIPGIIRTIIYFLLFIVLSGVGLLLPFLHPFNFLIVVAVADSVFDFRKLRARGESDGK